MRLAHVQRSWVVLAILLLASCSQLRESDANLGNDSRSGRPAMVTQGEDIFLARVKNSYDIGAPEARINGAFDVENSCLVFRSGRNKEASTALLPADAALSIVADKVTLKVGERTIAMGQTFVAGGGPVSGAGLNIDPRCPKAVTLITEIFE